MTVVASGRRRESTPDTAALSSIVDRCRRRGRQVMFVKSLTLAWAIGFAGLGAVRMGWPGPALEPAALIAAFGVLCAAAAALRFTPTTRQAAARIDRHLRLEDAVVAAIQAQGIDAAVAPLIVRQAVSRARDVDARAIFPLDIRRPAALLFGAALLMAVATLARDEERTFARNGGIASAAQSGAAGPAAEGRGAVQASGRTPRSAMAARTARGADAAASSQEQATPQQPDGIQRTADGQAASTETSEPGAGSGRRSTDRSARSEDRGSGRGTAAAGGTPLGASSGARGSARGFAGAGGIGGAAGAGTGVGAGGVRGGALVDARQEPFAATSRSAPPPQPAAVIAQARQRAEAALARGDIPPEMRSYVRAYFLAVTP